MATSDSPLNVPNVTLAVARGNSSAAPGQRVITGTGFGAGPNVVIFDRFEGAEFETLTNNRVADIGAWNKAGGHGVDPGIPKLFVHSGRTWLSNRQADRIQDSPQLWTSLEVEFDPSTEFRLSHRVLTPSEYLFPGANSLGVFPDSSSFKMVWIASADINAGIGPTDGQADNILPTHGGAGNIYVGGNSIGPTKVSNNGLLYTTHTIGKQHLYSWYQSGDESFEGANDSELELFTGQEGATFLQQTLGDAYAPNGEDPAVKAYSGARMPGWFGNNGGGSWANSLALQADFYLAIGPNSRACIITGDAPALLDCTMTYMLPPDQDVQGSSIWSDSEIRYTPREREDLPYTHLILADGTVVNNATTS